jgi:hypothetical protein
MQHDDKPLRELDDTKASAAEDRFEEMVTKVKAAGADITMDEESPLYTDIAGTETPIGRRRSVEFNLNHTDFQITRDEKNARIIGVGHRASLQELPTPSVIIKLKKKPEISNQWVQVDIEDMF